MQVQDPEAMIKNPENAKETIVSQPPEGSFASISTVEQLYAEMEKGEEVRAAAASDPAYSELLDTQQMRIMQNPRGRKDPTIKVSAMFARGDRVYHKKHKQEATVREVGADGRVRVKWRNGERSWVRPDNIVKL